MRILRFASMLVLVFAFIGCSKNQSQPSASAPPPMADATTQAPSMPMMKEDPRSIKSVEGTIKEVSINEIVVYTRKNVSLKFKVDADTIIKPKQALIPGMCVNIEIQHLPYGMKAKKIDIHTANDANHCA